jgi:hypothetical protein
MPPSISKPRTVTASLAGTHRGGAEAAFGIENVNGLVDGLGCAGGSARDVGSMRRVACSADTMGKSTLCLLVALSVLFGEILLNCLPGLEKSLERSQKNSMAAARAAMKSQYLWRKSAIACKAATITDIIKASRINIPSTFLDDDLRPISCSNLMVYGLWFWFEEIVKKQIFI